MFIDSHCHLTSVPDLGRAVAEANAAGVTTMVTIAEDLASSAECVQLAHSIDGVYAAVGIHPNNAIEATEGVLARIEDLASRDRVVAIGETGIDLFRKGAPPIRQEESFRAQIRIARDYDRAVSIHDREAHDDVVRILLSEEPLPRVVFHCFSGGPDLVETCVEHGWYMSFAGNVTFKNAQKLQEAAKRVPLDLLMIETDSPFLTPHPHRGTPNSPAMVTVTAAFLAELHEVDIETIANVTTTNTINAYALPEPTGEPQ